MKIGIEAQRIFRKKKHGMDIYALELIRNLQMIDQINEYYIFVRPGEDRCLKETTNFKIIEIKALTYADWEQIQLPRVAALYDLDLLHCTSNTAPIFSPAPLHLTLHDIIYLHQEFSGGSLYQRLGHYYRKWIVPLAFRKAKKVFTVSNFEKKQIDAHFGDSDKVSVVYNGVSDRFQPASKEVIGAAKVRYELPQHFIFFLGNTVPKKNMAGMLKAYHIYRTQEKKPMKLVIAESSEEDLDKMLSKLNLEKLRQDIVLTGYVPQKDLPALYSAADLFVYPSLRESFGIPILEAMACGTAVITSNTSSMPEVAGLAAKQVDPFIPESIAMGISDYLSSYKYFKRFTISEGLARAEKFSWEVAARMVTNHYQNRNVQYSRISDLMSV